LRSKENEWRVCAVCEHWDKSSDIIGECRHNSPVLDQNADNSVAIWPVTKDKGWCSFFEPDRDTYEAHEEEWIGRGY